MDTSSSDTDEQEDAYDNFWNFIYKDCGGKEYKQFLEDCIGFLDLYSQSKKDDLFQEIMDDANKFEVDGMKYAQALAASILKHKGDIAVKVDFCKKITYTRELDLWR